MSDFSINNKSGGLFGFKSQLKDDYDIRADVSSGATN